MAVLNTSRLALPYPDGNDLLRDGDNRIHDLAEALDDIVATVDELAAIELTPGPPGPSGQSAGKIFYFAPSDASDIATYKTMLTSPSVGAEQTIATPCTGTGDVLIAAFATDPGVPGAVDYPAGTAFRRVYANVQAGGARLHLRVYKRDAAGTETLVRDELSDVFVNQTVALQEWVATGSAAGAVLDTDRLVAKLYGQRTTGPTTVTVTTYYEGSAHTSQIQTTISAGAQGPAGPAGPAGAAGQGVPVGGTTGQVLTKTSATDYATSWQTPSGGGGGAMVWRGPWNSATAYAVGDLVSRSGSTYIATATSTGDDPNTFSALTRLAGNSVITTSFGSGSAFGAVAAKFQVTSGITINGIRFNRVSGQTQWAVCGIASSLGANAASIVWLSRNDAANLNGSGWRTIPIPSITLNTGTDYFVVQTTPNGGDAYQVNGSNSGAPGTYTGLSSVTSWAINNQTSAWINVGANNVVGFDLGTITAEPWAMFAQSAAAPA